MVDAATSRGIPMVKLTTFNSIEHYTDSSGQVAFLEPGLMGREVWFGVESPGYTFPKDLLGFAGVTLRTDTGSSATVVMTREQPAQRMYRITGQGIYRDSVLLGDTPPIREPLLNASVTGQDGGYCVDYRGRLMWVWGDTALPPHPMGLFGGTAAMADRPGAGGLDPDVGVNLEYFQHDGKAKDMIDIAGQGAYWIGAIVSVRDRTGREHLIADCLRVKPPFEMAGRFIIEFDDETETFRSIHEETTGTPILQSGQATRCSDDGTSRIVFFSDSRLYRVADSYESAIDPTQYEAWTCLRQGEKEFKCRARQLDRGRDGSLRWGWKRGTAAVGQNELARLEKAGLARPRDCWIRFTEARSRKRVKCHNGNLAWNAYRGKWTLLFNQADAEESPLGEIHYAEADSITGPWTRCWKVATHPKYSFYNPTQHPQLAKDNGRVIYFEGAYSKSFTPDTHAVPRYDYNMMMYRLELDDPRLALPPP